MNKYRFMSHVIVRIENLVFMITSFRAIFVKNMIRTGACANAALLTYFKTCNFNVVLIPLHYVDINLMPKTECLKDTVARALPYWFDTIVPEILVIDIFCCVDFID